MAIETGRIRVQNRVVSLNYVIQNGDVITHNTHRHEPPVLYVPSPHLTSPHLMFHVSIHPFTHVCVISRILILCVVFVLFRVA